MEATEEVELREGPLDSGGVAAGGACSVDVMEHGVEDAAPLRVEGGGCRGDHEDIRPAELLVLLHDCHSCISRFRSCTSCSALQAR